MIIKACCQPQHIIIILPRLKIFQIFFVPAILISLSTYIIIYACVPVRHLVVDSITKIIVVVLLTVIKIKGCQKTLKDILYSEGI